VSAIAEMDKVTQSNASSAEESAAASEQLSAQARELSDQVGVLIAIVDGSAARRSAGPDRRARATRASQEAPALHVNEDYFRRRTSMYTAPRITAPFTMFWKE
jgi:hypothetical protein